MSNICKEKILVYLYGLMDVRRVAPWRPSGIGYLMYPFFALNLTVALSIYFKSIDEKWMGIGQKLNSLNRAHQGYCIIFFESEN
jgi:hypothetical protein